MRVLTVPNWSFGRDRRLLADVRELLEARPVTVHFADSDVDHNRTVTAFSGEPEDVREALFALADRILPAIDLQRHRGVHPRIGALDVCPFVPLRLRPSASDSTDLIVFVQDTARQLAERYEVPVFLYEQSERGKHAAALPKLRKGGFGGLVDRDIEPDFGPHRVHPHLGATVMGVRDFLIAYNVNLRTETADVAKTIARSIRERREQGDERFTGVRALGLMLAAQEMSQVSMNVTRPDAISLDALTEWVVDVARMRGAEFAYTELIGVIRIRDLEHATHLHPRQEQIVKYEEED